MSSDDEPAEDLRALRLLSVPSPSSDSDGVRDWRHARASSVEEHAVDVAHVLVLM